jgi:bacteriocin-like protein
MRELNVNELQEVNGGVVFLVPPLLTFAVKVTGISIGTIVSSISIYSAYNSLKD